MSGQDNTEGTEQLTAAQRRVVVRPRLFSAITALAEDRETDVTEEVNRAVREMLEREGRWPTSSDKGHDA